jgi:hypothetical protein
MPYLTIARMEGEPDRLIEGYLRNTEVMDGVGRDHGLMLHGGARTGDGLLIVNLWPSRDDSEAAAADPRRLSVLEREASAIRGLDKEHYELDHCLVLGGERGRVPD